MALKAASTTRTVTLKNGELVLVQFQMSFSSKDDQTEDKELEQMLAARIASNGYMVGPEETYFAHAITSVIVGPGEPDDG